MIAEEETVFRDVCCPPDTCYWSEKCFMECGAGYERMYEGDWGSCDDLCCPAGFTEAPGFVPHAGTTIG